MNHPDPAVTIGERLAAVRQRIGDAGGRGVRVVVVTKTFPAAVVDAVVTAGGDGIGENYAQEVVAKWPELTTAPTLHFIGQLQTNKVRSLAPYVAVWETLDRPSLVRELAKRVPGARVLVQVNTSGDPRKGGCPPAEAAGLIDLAGAAGLDVHGVMTVGPTAGTEAETVAGFEAVRGIADRHGLAVCSMGMSGDYELAVRCGATEVRVGSAVLGPRPPIHPRSDVVG